MLTQIARRQDLAISVRRDCKLNRWRDSVAGNKQGLTDWGQIKSSNQNNNRFIWGTGNVVALFSLVKLFSTATANKSFAPVNQCRINITRSILLVLALAAIGPTYARAPEPVRIAWWGYSYYPNCAMSASTPEPILTCLKALNPQLWWWTPYHCYETGISYSNSPDGMSPTVGLLNQCDNGPSGEAIYGHVVGVTSAPVDAGAPCTEGICQSAGNPINSGTGNKFQAETDYQGTTGSRLTFTRFYNSTPVVDGPLGAYWRHSFQTNLTFRSYNTTVTVWQADGKGVIFSKSGSSWISTNGVQYRLTQQLDGSGNTLYWRYTGPDDTIQQFNDGGQLTSITYRDGQQLTLTYIPLTFSYIAGQPLTPGSMQALSTVTDSFGRTLSFQYDEQSGRIHTVTTPDGNTITYAYDSNNNLVSATYPDNKVRTYKYNEISNGSIPSGSSFPYALTGIVDENNQRFATFKYDASGRGISTEHGDGISVDKYSLSYSGSNTTVTDPSGTARTYTFQSVLGATRSNNQTQPNVTGVGTVSQSVIYNSNGYISSKTDFNGNKTTYLYQDPSGRVDLETSRTEGLTSSGGTTPQTRTITTQWHPNFRLIRKQAEPLKITTYIYNDAATDNGNCVVPTSTTLPVICQKIEQGTTDPVGALGIAAQTTGTPRTWTYTYNALGQVLTADGPRTDVNDTTTYTYYTSASTTPGSVHSVGDLATVTNALGHVTSITNYDLNGRPLSITDPNNVVTTLTYWPRGWLKTRTVNGVQTTKYDYDGVGQLTQVTLPDNSALKYTYDSAHRLTDIEDGYVVGGNLTLTGNKIHYTLDAMGNRTQEDTKDPGNAIVKTRSRVFDALNRLQQDIGGTSPGTQITQYGYDNNGNLKTVTDPLSHTTTNGYDALNRLITVTDPANGVATTTYNARDQVTAVSDPRLVTTNYTIDALGNVTLTQSPDSGNTAQVFDAAGNVTQKTDARGIVSNYTYDALNRLTGISYPASTSENVTFTYDTVGASYYRIGRLSGVNSNNFYTVFGYDAYGNTTLRAELTPQFWMSGYYQYDSANRLQQITYPSGRIVIYTRNNIGQIIQVQTQDDANAPLQTVVSNVGYEPFGPIKSLTFGSGIGAVATSIQHDADYRVSRITTTSTPSWDYIYSYDAAGNLTSMADQVGSPNRSKTYSYDSLNRLLSGSGPNSGITWNYQYDAGGNRTSAMLGSYTLTSTFAANSNRQTDYSGNAITMDAAGNLSVEGTNWFSAQYNSANRMSQSTNGGTVGYQYNGLGLRMIKQVTQTAQNTVYEYLPDGKYLAEVQLDANSNYVRSAEYIWLDDLPIAQVQTNYGANNAVSSRVLTYIHADHLNTPRAMTDSNHKIVWRWDSDAYGLSTPNTDPDGDGIQNYLNLRFPGQTYDQETALAYNINRYYDALRGLYTQSDPAGLEGGLNTYSYAENDPVRNVDPLGLWVKRCSRQLGNKDRPATSRFNPFRHEYLNVSGTILSFQAGDSMLWGQGRLDNNEDPSKGCTMFCSDDKFDAYVIKAAQEIGAPTYCVAAFPGTTMHILGARNCQTWVSDVLKKAKEEYQKNEKCPQCK